MDARGNRPVDLSAAYSTKGAAQIERRIDMQFMIMMIPAVYRDNKKLDKKFVPDPKTVQEMGRFNEELSKQIKLLSLNGLHPLSTGARVSFSKGKTTVTDGPFVEAKEVLGGYWIVEADSKEQLVRLMQQCPAEDGDVIEIRQIFSPADFAITK
jgi:hypothetical protein